MLRDVFPLGPFLVEEDGKLSFKRPDAEPGFSFLWRGRRVGVRMRDGAMSFTGVVAQVPSSALGATRRQACFEALRALKRLMPRGWSIRLTPGHKVQVEAMESLEWPAHASQLIHPIVSFLLKLSPYLDMMEEAGLG